MPACKLLAPPSALSREHVEIVEIRTIIASGPDIPDIRNGVTGAADLRGRFKSRQWLHRALSVYPIRICRVHRKGRCRARRELPAIADCLGQFAEFLSFVRYVVANSFTVVGHKGIERREDERLLTGRGRYLDDLELPGALSAAFLRSMYAHANIINIDADANALQFDL